MGRAEEIARRTPADRDRFVDFLRAGSITMVVLGHWLVVAVFVDDGAIRGVNALAVLPWTHLATWLFQVMPVFFLVGGFANKASWDSHRRREGGGWVPWALERTDRLLRPTTFYLAIGVAAVAAARGAGLDPELADDAGWLVNIALWFLAIYVGISAGAPLMIAAHERWGIRVPAVLIGGVAAVDVVSIGAGVRYVGSLNFALGWLTFQQLGFLWRDGMLTRRRALAPVMAVGGAAALVSLTFVGPYPVSMVGVPGAEIQNTAPPTVALLVLGVTQAGVALTVRPLVDRALARPAVWMAVVGVNAAILTVYLWHLVPVLPAAALIAAVPGVPQPAMDTGAWLALRVPWVAVLGILLVPLVVLAGRIEWAEVAKPEVPGSGFGTLAAVLVALGVLLASGGLAMFTLEGMHGDGPLGLPLAALATYASGVVALRLAAKAPALSRRAGA